MCHITKACSHSHEMIFFDMQANSVWSASRISILAEHDTSQWKIHVKSYKAIVVFLTAGMKKN